MEYTFEKGKKTYNATTPYWKNAEKEEEAKTVYSLPRYHQKTDGYQRQKNDYVWKQKANAFTTTGITRRFHPKPQMPQPPPPPPQRRLVFMSQSLLSRPPGSRRPRPILPRPSSLLMPEQSTTTTTTAWSLVSMPQKSSSKTTTTAWSSVAMPEKLTKAEESSEQNDDNGVVLQKQQHSCGSEAKYAYCLCWEKDFPIYQEEELKEKEGEKRENNKAASSSDWEAQVFWKEHHQRVYAGISSEEPVFDEGEMTIGSNRNSHHKHQRSNTLDDDRNISETNQCSDTRLYVLLNKIFNKAKMEPLESTLTTVYSAVKYKKWSLNSSKNACGPTAVQLCLERNQPAVAWFLIQLGAQPVRRIAYHYPNKKDKVVYRDVPISKEELIAMSLHYPRLANGVQQKSTPPLPPLYPWLEEKKPNSSTTTIEGSDDNELFQSMNKFLRSQSQAYPLNHCLKESTTATTTTEETNVGSSKVTAFSRGFLGTYASRVKM